MKEGIIMNIQEPNYLLAMTTLYNNIQDGLNEMRVWEHNDINTLSGAKVLVDNEMHKILHMINQPIFILKGDE